MTTSGRGVRHAFRALHHRDFALFWAGAFVSSIGMWMQNVTVPFLLHEATGSAAWVGLGAFAQFAPAMVVSPLGGSLADRHSRRTLLIWSQAAAMVMAFALWLSVRGGQIRPGVIVASVPYHLRKYGVPDSVAESLAPHDRSRQRKSTNGQALHRPKRVVRPRSSPHQ